jgi:hypothetical protein
MPEAIMFDPCAAIESSSHRGVRYAAGALLVVFAFAECAMAALMIADGHGTPQVLYLLCSLALFAAAVIAVRERDRALVAVRIAAVAAAVTLFWSMSVNAGPSITMHGHLHDLTPVLAGMLLGAVLLPRLLSESDSEAACNCQ